MTGKRAGHHARQPPPVHRGPQKRQQQQPVKTQHHRHPFRPPPSKRAVKKAKRSLSPDSIPCCAATAVADHLRLAAGIAVSGADILRLHYSAGGTDDEGVTIARMLHALECEGIGGIIPLDYGLAESWSLSEEQWLLLGMTLTEAQQQQVLWDYVQDSPEWDGHAGVLRGSEMVTWDTAIPVTPGFLAAHAEESWTIRWH